LFRFQFCFFVSVKFIVYLYLVFLFQQVNAQNNDSIDNTIFDTTERMNTFDSDSLIASDTFVFKVPFVIPDSILQLAIDTATQTAKWQASPESIYKSQQAGKIISNQNNKKPNWLFFLFVLQVLILIYLKITSYKNIEDSLKAYFNINLSQQLFREQENNISFGSFIQMINFLFSCALLIYLIVEYYFLPTFTSSINIALAILLFVTLVYLLKYIGYKFLAFVFPFSEEVSVFRFSYFLNQKLLGIFLIPFIYAAAYNSGYWGNFFLTVAIMLFLITILIRTGKGILISMKMIRKNLFHFLLYICAFEIAPVLILLKWLQMLGYGQ